MKRIFDQLTRLEFEALKAYYINSGMNERVFYNLKKKTEVPDTFMIALYEACGIDYDFRTGNMTRLPLSESFKQERP